MIRRLGNVFVLDTPNTTYAFGVIPSGQLEHLYYGEKISIDTEEEAAVFKRGRNAHSAHSPKNQSADDYRYATGFEALFGYLYLCGNTDRLKELFNESTYKAYKEIN